jgi:inhibitor of KinA sporulation pathway (predicted exonuclease)
MKDTNYFALDLELNNKSDGTTPKIIEVGIAWGSPLRFNEIKKFNWYLNPGENITPFITKLTGITDQIIEENSLSHEIVAQELGDILTINNVFTNPIVWGQGDASALLNEFKERDIKFPFFGHRIFDVKHLFVFDQLVAGKSAKGSLKSALSANKMKFQGEAHSASDDAYNTLRLFFQYMMKRKRLMDAINLINTSL